MDFSFKELYDCYLKLTYSIGVGNRTLAPGEAIAHFDEIQVAGLNETAEFISANGGYGNSGRVFWNTVKEIDFVFSQGTFNQTQFALMSNSKMIETAVNDSILLTKQEVLESDENYQFILAEMPKQNLFVYNKASGEKLEFTRNEKVITISTQYTDVVVNYEYEYLGGGRAVRIGNEFVKGFLSFEGKTWIKDDKTGIKKTGIIKIPKLKLMSDLSMRLGTNASPITCNFRGKGYPVGARGSEYVSEFIFLNNDVDSDF